MTPYVSATKPKDRLLCVNMICVQILWKNRVKEEVSRAFFTMQIEHVQYLLHPQCLPLQHINLLEGMSQTISISSEVINPLSGLSGSIKCLLLMFSLQFLLTRPVKGDAQQRGPASTVVTFFQAF